MSILDFNFDFSGGLGNVLGSGTSYTGGGSYGFTNENVSYDFGTGFSSTVRQPGLDYTQYYNFDAASYSPGSFDYSVFSGLDTSSGFDWASIINAGSKFITAAPARVPKRLRPSTSKVCTKCRPLTRCAWHRLSARR